MSYAVILRSSIIRNLDKAAKLFMAYAVMPCRDRKNYGCKISYVLCRNFTVIYNTKLRQNNAKLQWLQHGCEIFANFLWSSIMRNNQNCNTVIVRLCN
jgi:hypothetical protein